MRNSSNCASTNLIHIIFCSQIPNFAADHDGRHILHVFGVLCGGNFLRRVRGARDQGPRSGQHRQAIREKGTESIKISSW